MIRFKKIPEDIYEHMDLLTHFFMDDSISSLPIFLEGWLEAKENL